MTNPVSQEPGSRFTGPAEPESGPADTSQKKRIQALAGRLEESEANSSAPRSLLGRVSSFFSTGWKTRCFIIGKQLWNFFGREHFLVQAALDGDIETLKAAHDLGYGMSKILDGPECYYYKRGSSVKEAVEQCLYREIFPRASEGIPTTNEIRWRPLAPFCTDVEKFQSVLEELASLELDSSHFVRRTLYFQPDVESFMQMAKTALESGVKVESLQDACISYISELEIKTAERCKIRYSEKSEDVERLARECRELMLFLLDDLGCKTDSLEKQNVIHLACKYGCTDIVERLLEMGIGIDSISERNDWDTTRCIPKGGTPLAVALLSEHADLMEVLIDKGARVVGLEEKLGPNLLFRKNNRNRQKYTLLEAAFVHSDAATLKKFFEIVSSKGIDLGNPDELQAILEDTIKNCEDCGLLIREFEEKKAVVRDYIEQETVRRQG